MFGACVGASQQDPKTFRGMGGMKILALPSRTLFKEQTNLTWSRRILSGV